MGGGWISAERKRMVVVVKTLLGITLNLDVEPNDSIANVKTRMFFRTGIPSNQQRWIYGTQETRFLAV